ncbi:MAG: aminoglycoside 6-adenylyltransferase [Ferruginibacter sp.]
MRSEEEIITLILTVAKSDERIRAVLLNGSRANLHIKPDLFQDFDIVYIVNEINTFINDHTWIDIFGERLMLQMPGDMAFGEEKNSNISFRYLMLFKDHNRIDLTLFPLDKFENEFEHDSLAILLWDKDNLFPNLPASSDIDYHIKRPTQKMFADCCNEFWWVCTNVAKGLWRQEITYARDMLEMPVRKMFLQIIAWHIGVETGFSVSFGKSGKNMQSLLSPVLYDKILLTCPDADLENTWKSLFIMADIFSDLAVKISGNLCFEYNLNEDHNVTAYLKWVCSLTNETNPL